MRTMYDVPSNVIENVEKYLKENLPNYKLVKVLRKSSHPADDYLYMVIAKKELTPEQKSYGFGQYTVWSCWNETTQSLNCGHYNIETENDAFELAKGFYNEL